MFPVVRTDTAGALNPVTGPRSATNGRVVAALDDDRPILAFGPIEPGDASEQQPPPSFFGRFQTPSEAFAAALSIRRLDEVDEEPRFDAFRGPRPFSGLVVRAVNLYEATSQFLDGTPPRGGAVNAHS